MSFFEGRARRTPQPDEPQWKMQIPDWDGPPQNALPARSDQRVEVFRTADAALVVDQFNVYPTGVEFTVELRVRQRFEPGFRLPVDSSAAIATDVVRFAVVLADGWSWLNVDAPEDDTWQDAADGGDRQHVVLPTGGTGHERQWSLSYWMWPLPSAGALTVVADWPAMGITESSGGLDANELRKFATSSTQLW